MGRSTENRRETDDPEDWRWQLRNATKSSAELQQRLQLSQDEILGASRAEAGHGMPLLVTPYLLSLCDPDNPECPIRRQFVPVEAEASRVTGDLIDPLGERAHEVAPGLIRRYPDRVLLLVSGSCGAHCRFCTRSRVVAHENGYINQARLAAAVSWLRENPQVKEVILSGGDPLIASTQRLSAVLTALRSVPNIETIRVGTRVPSVLPMRIDNDLVVALRAAAPVWIMTHFNHPKELTPRAIKALSLLVDGGLPVMNQTVLLRGINDDPAVLADLFRGLVRARVKPYYLLHADVVEGTGHLRTTIARSVAVFGALQGRLSGIALPKLIVDTPGGRGKVPIGPQTMVAQGPGRTTLRTFRGELVDVIDPPSVDHPQDKA